MTTEDPMEGYYLLDDDDELVQTDQFKEENDPDWYNFSSAFPHGRPVNVGARKESFRNSVWLYRRKGERPKLKEGQLVEGLTFIVEYHRQNGRPSRVLAVKKPEWGCSCRNLKNFVGDACYWCGKKE